MAANVVADLEKRLQAVETFVAKFQGDKVKGLILAIETIMDRSPSLKPVEDLLTMTYEMDPETVDKVVEEMSEIFEEVGFVFQRPGIDYFP